MKFKKIQYKELNARQKESFNFHKVASILAEYGFSCMWLNDDWQGADFIANHVDGETFLKVQLKGRLTLDKKYCGKNIFIAFPNRGRWYLYEHDKVKKILFAKGLVVESKSWENNGNYSWRTVPRNILEILKNHEI